MLFAYKALRVDGSFEKGNIEAKGQTEALASLRRNGKTVVNISEIRGPVAATGASVPQRPLQLATFFSDLAMLMTAGLTVDQALKTMAASQEDRRLKAIASRMAAGLATGDTVAMAMAKTGSFPQETTALAASAERVGRLAEVFGAMAADFERQAKARRALFEALAYPAFLVVLAIVAVVLISVYLVPALEPIFESAGVDSPPVVWILMQLREFMIGYGVYLAGMAAILTIAACFAETRTRIFAFFSSIWAALPGVGRIQRDLAMARYLQSLALLLQNGAQISLALELSAACCSRESFRIRLAGVRDEVAHGANVTDALRRTQLFGNATLSLVFMGDEANRLPMALDRSSMILMTRSRQVIDKALAVLAPAIIILLGIMIGLLVTSVMTALLSVNELAIQ